MKPMSAKDPTLGETLAVLSTDIKYIKDDIQSIKSQLNEVYVRKDEFEPIKRVVYGLVGIILATVVGAWASLTTFHK